MKNRSRLLKILCESCTCCSSTLHACPTTRKKGNEGTGSCSFKGDSTLIFLISLNLLSGRRAWALNLFSARTDFCSHAENRNLFTCWEQIFVLSGQTEFLFVKNFYIYIYLIWIQNPSHRRMQWTRFDSKHRLLKRTANQISVRWFLSFLPQFFVSDLRSYPNS